MHQVRFTRSSLLSFVFPGREKVGASQQIKIRLRMIPFDLVADFFDTNHKKQWSEVSDQSSVISGQ
jgi:hypothetical protein